MWLQACCDCKLMPFTTQRGHLGLECFRVCLLSVDKYPGACGAVMWCISLRAPRQKSSPADRVSQPQHSGTAGLLLHILSGHVPSESGMLDRVPEHQGLHLLSVEAALQFYVPLVLTFSSCVTLGGQWFSNFSGHQNSLRGYRSIAPWTC